ncbi:hypothetical protein SDC9_13058 [bioreactor metagenome]|uniref:Uncharacterized protein n=1 Tax=bioreactor metagenome TaxID=1076179 RepID=A0A644TLV2_9ZZZZ
MQPVFRLVEDHRMRPVHHRARRLVVAMRRQAMHEQRVGLRLRHQRLVHLIGAQLVVPPLLRRFRVVHRDPGVGDDQVRTLDRLRRVALDLDRHPLRAGEVDPFALGVEGLRPGEGEVEAELPGRLQERGADVVAVARPDHLAPGDRAAVLLIGHDVGHDLARVGAVRQPVDDGHRGVFRHLEQRRLLEGADHDHVNIARQNPRGVGDGLAMAKLHFLARKHHRLPAQLAHTDVEADTGAGRGFFEDQCDHAARQRLLVVGRALRAAGAGVLHRAGRVDDLAQLGGVGGVDVKEVGHRFVFLAQAGAQPPRLRSMGLVRPRV